MSETLPEDETVNEITRATVPRQDAVMGPASGRPFLMLKNQRGVRTTPAQAGALMKAAADRSQAEKLLKAAYSADALREMGAKGHAFRNDDGTYSYPIGNTSDLHNAIRAVGRGGSSHEALRRYIRRRASELGATGAIPESWSAEGKITKAMDIGDVQDDMKDLAMATEIKDGDVVEDAGGLVAPTHPGDPTDPGSPAWEAVDAAQARGALSYLNRLSAILCDLESREGQEAVSGLPAEGSMIDLSEAKAALDFVVGVMAKFANDEQAEADRAAAEIDKQAEAMGIRKSQQEAPVTEPTPTTPAVVPPLLGETGPELIQKAGLDADAMRSMMKKIIASMSDEQVAAAFGDMAQHASVSSGDENAPADEGPAGDGTAAPAAPAGEPIDKAAGPSDVPAPADANRSDVPGPDTTPVGVGDGQVPIVKAQEAEPEDQATTLQKALDTYGATLSAQFEDRLRAVLTETVAPMQETIKKMQERVLPGGPLLNGVSTPPPDVEGRTVTRGQQASTDDPMMAIRKQLQEITDPDQRAKMEGMFAVELMKAQQTTAGRPPTFGPR